MNEWSKPRTIFAAMFYISFLALVIMGKVKPDGVENIVLMLLSFYFGQKTKKEQ